MEPKVNYTIVGLFVIGLLIAIIVMTLWLSVGLSDNTYKTYRVYMNESVAGLSIDSPVQYNGVTVGHITNISLNDKNPQQVKLLLAIQTDTPITESTTATLMSQGLTGIAYIGLRSNSANLKPLQTEPGEDYPVIKTSPSLMMRLDTAVSALTMNLTQISTELHSILDSDNRQALKQTLQNINQLTSSLANNSKELSSTLKSANIIMANTAKTSQQFPDLLKNGQMTLQILNEQTLPTINSLISNLNTTSNNLLITSKNIKQNPSVILRGETPPPPGPGER